MAADSGSPGDDTYTQINACIQKVATGPIRGREKTHLMTGHVHKPYPRIYVLLARLAGFDSAAIIRGVEGGVIPSLKQPAAVTAYHGEGEARAFDVHPGEIGMPWSTPPLSC